MICDKCKKEIDGEVKEVRKSFGPILGPGADSVLEKHSQHDIIEKLKPHKLTEWENGFLDTIAGQDNMSFKQREILKKIVTKYLLKKGYAAMPADDLEIPF